MADDTTSSAPTVRPAYAYPADLARFVRDQWGAAPEVAIGSEPSPPDVATLERFLSPCYQASMLREEERPVTLRAILASPEMIAAEGRPPEGLLQLAFSNPLPFEAAELRRLSAAVDERHALLGAWQETDGGLHIWGLVHSGTWWLRDVQGGRRAGAPLPDAPVVLVDSPGSLSVHRGYRLVATLKGGRLSGCRVDPYGSAWLPDQFVGFRNDLLERHREHARRARERSGETWAQLDDDLLHKIAERMMKRVTAMLRADHHGATLVFVPEEHVERLAGEDPLIDLKYRFAEDRSRFSFPDLLVNILDRLAQLHGGAEAQRRPPLGWADFEAATDNVLATLDESVFEMAHLTAGLASVDGAVVITKRHELLGFGGMISGRVPAARRVGRALDLEGHRVVEEETVGVGARHHSAYRLAAALPGAVVIVISQDGGVRFVAHRDGRVVYWELE